MVDERIRTTDACFLGSAQGVQALGLLAVGFNGNFGRNVLTGPRLTNVDKALMKTTILSEGKTVQFRAEVFNIANHAKLCYAQRRRIQPGSDGRNRQRQSDVWPDHQHAHNIAAGSAWCETALLKRRMDSHVD